MAIINMVGDHGIWRVTDQAESDNHGARWNCTCIHCGYRTSFSGYYLRRGARGCPKCKTPTHRVLAPSQVKRTVEYQRPAPLPPPPRLLSDDDAGVTGRCSLCNRQSVFYSGRCHWCGQSGTRDVSQHVRAG